MNNSVGCRQPKSLENPLIYLKGGILNPEEPVLIERKINGIVIQQLVADGLINGTAMSVAHNKDLKDWFTAKDTLELMACVLS